MVLAMKNMYLTATTNVYLHTKLKIICAKENVLLSMTLVMENVIILQVNFTAMENARMRELLAMESVHLQTTGL